MCTVTIGIQTIMPKTGTSPKDPPPQPANARESDQMLAKQAPPPAGMGKLVDKTA